MGRQRGFPVYASLFGRRSALPILAAALGFFLMAAPARAEIGTYILVDARNGAVVDQKNATRKWYPASLTKMMTAYVTFKAIREGRVALDSAVVQSKNSLCRATAGGGQGLQGHHLLG
jgi:D-alanyl-D-alanine carboxypeptidase